jgi:pimeloyl-ACP methyl ester carboxylesterase
LSTTNGIRTISLNANGYVFDALAAGPDDAPLVLFLHGFPQFANAWTPILLKTAAAGYRCVAVDQRGYSKGARPQNVADYDVRELTSDVLAFADALGAKQFHLVGHDWGGAVAWKVAAAHPDRLRSLTVLATPHSNAILAAIASDPDQRERSRYIEFFRQPGGAAEASLLAQGGQHLRSVYRGKLDAGAVEENVRRFSEPGTLTAVLNWYRAMDESARIGKIQTPTLFLWGSQDQALGAVAATGTAEFVSGPYQFVRLEGCTHWLLEEAPEPIATHLINHLANW